MYLIRWYIIQRNKINSLGNTPSVLPSFIPVVLSKQTLR